MSRALCDTVPHVAVAHGGHRNHSPPECVRDGFEERLLGAGFSEIHDARKQHHSCNRQKKQAREGRDVPVSRRSTIHHTTKITNKHKITSKHHQMCGNQSFCPFKNKLILSMYWHFMVI